MSIEQSSIFLQSEGNAWFDRMVNSSSYRENMQSGNEFYLGVFSSLPKNFSPKSILEIGCSDGHKLDKLYERYRCNCYGIDPSEKAIIEGGKKYPHLDIRQGVAEQLIFNNDFFDIVIFGFCLYLCDRKNLFRITYEADRVLKEEGYLVVMDFYPSDFYYKNKYKHYNGVFSYKMDYSKMFLWNKQYSLVSVTPLSHFGYSFHPQVDERVCIHVLYKNKIDEILHEGSF